MVYLLILLTKEDFSVVPHESINIYFGLYSTQMPSLTMNEISSGFLNSCLDAAVLLVVLFSIITKIMV